MNQKSIQDLQNSDNRDQKISHIDISTQLSEQLERSNESNKELLQKLQLILQENEKLKLQLQTNDQKQQKVQALEGQLLRQTQLREEVRKEVEEKFKGKHQQELNMVITKFSREKAMMIKTIEKQRLRILDNERIMLQMEGDLERVKDSNIKTNKSQNPVHKFIKNSFEIPEEQTQSQVEQTDINSCDKIPQFGQQKNLLTPQIKLSLEQNKTHSKQQQVNKTIENNHNVKLQSSSSKVQNNMNGGGELNSYTNLPSSQQSTGNNNNHKRFSSTSSTPQQIPVFDLFCVQYEQNTPQKNAFNGSKSLTSASKQLTQSQSTNVTNRSNSKYLTTSSANNLTYQKRNSFNNGNPMNTKNVPQTQRQKNYYLTPHQQQFNQTMNSQYHNSSNLSSTIAPLSEQLGIRSSLHSQLRCSEQTQPDHELSPLNIPMKKLSISLKQPNSNSMTPTSITHSQRNSNISQLNPTNQGEMYSQTLIYNSDQSLQIYNRFKNNVDSLSQF